MFVAHPAVCFLINHIILVNENALLEYLCMVNFILHTTRRQMRATVEHVAYESH